MEESAPQVEYDEVVQEIPIYHSTRLGERLFVFKYPLIPNKCCDETQVKRGFFKPTNQQVQLEMGISIESPNFDSDRAELIAEEVDGPADSRKTSNVHFESGLVDKVYLQSWRSVKNCDKYAALVYTGKEVHLTALKNIFEFYSPLTYMDKGGKKKKDSDHNDLSDSEEAGPSNTQAITVRFKQSDDRWKKARSESYRALEAKNAEEPWLKCQYHSRDSTLSNVEKLKLLSDNADDAHQVLDLSTVEYLRTLVPDDKEQAVIQPTLPSHIITLHALRALPVAEQCRLLLKVAPIIQFQQLFMILAGGEGLTQDVLLKNLPKVAVLVRGNWVVKSEIVYPANSLSGTSGVPAELMCRTRDYVLYLFTKHDYVDRKKVSSIMKIPSEEVKEIFMGFSKLRHNKGWELELPTDHDFIIKHGDLVQKQNDVWEQRFKQLSEFLKDNKKQRRKSKSISEDSKTRTNHTGPVQDRS